MKKLSTLMIVISLSSFSFAQQKNLVLNAGFETGEFTPWIKGPTANYTNPVIYFTDSYNGTYHAVYINSKPSGFYQNIDIEENTKYTVSFWYKATGNGFGTRIWSSFLSTNNKSIDLITPSSNNPLKSNNKYLPKTEEWKQHIVEFTSPNNVAKFHLAVRVYNNSTVSFDDFSLVEGTLSTLENYDFQKQVKMNTIVSDKLIISLPSKSTVNIYSVNGQLISSNRIDIGQIINTQSLVKGTYIVTVDNGKSKITQKIIKK